MTGRQVLAIGRTAVALAASLVIAGCAGASAAPSNGGAGAPAGCPTSQPAPLSAGQTRSVTVHTAQGTIVIRVEASLSPVAAGNFVALASCGYYDGVVFHRVVPGFVIQGGDGQFGRADRLGAHVGAGGPGYTIADEPVTATYGRGVVAMARSSQPHSEGSQFFIVLSDEARESLESANTYAIFGHVTSGMEVADAIAAAADAEIPSHPVAMDAVTVANP
ncbi:MAG TPA: peptidylprolyl isomerase [Candidatus Limnocylindrales bacterium]|nr:peptidylprolyl isomerase [Candidatus Limnocylindrales bacterium]